MNHTSWRRIYDRFAPALALLVLLISVTAGIGTYFNDRANARQDHQQVIDTKQRETENHRLLECFDRFATALAGGLPPVRTASAARDDALADALVGDRASLRGVLGRVVTNKATPHDVTALITLLDAYKAANDHLIQVRTANPYPAAPSTFCGT